MSTATTANEEILTQASNVKMINIPPLVLVPFPMGNLRGKRSEAKVSSLRADMQQNGLIQPIVVRHITASDTFEVLAGFGRWENSKILKWANIACRIYVDITDQEALAIHIAENFQRENLSIISEADAAQKFFAMFKGDIDAAASQLSMTRRAFSERLELNRCTDFVKEKLENKEISTGHALIAASFPAKQQDRIISHSINVKLTVVDLRKLTSKAHRQLVDAKFCIDDCNGCEFNTKRQESLGLFDDEQEAQSQQGECISSPCYQKKTNEWLESQRIDAEERFGTVILFSSVGHSLSTLTKEVVGTEQFEQGCGSCTSNCAVMDDRADRLGMITSNQCIDQSCFAQKTKAKTDSEKVVKKQAVKQVTPKGSNTSSNDILEASSAADDVEISYTIHKRVEHHNKAELRKTSTQFFEKDTVFQLATILASLTRTTGYKVKELSRFDDVFHKALLLPAAEIQTHIAKAVAYMATSSSDDNGIDFTNLMIKALASKKEDGKVAAIAQWEATKESLENYTTSTMTLLLKDAKFDVFYKEKFGDCAFDKLIKGKKFDLVTAILASGFDWTHFAPREYLESLK